MWPSFISLFVNLVTNDSLVCHTLQIDVFEWHSYSLHP